MQLTLKEMNRLKSNCSATSRVNGLANPQSYCGEQLSCLLSPVSCGFRRCASDNDLLNGTGGNKVVQRVDGQEERGGAGFVLGGRIGSQTL